MDARAIEISDLLRAEPFACSVNGVRYVGYDSGGDGPPVLMLHGWPDDSSLWRHQFANLAQGGYRALAIDWIGHGASERVADARRYEISALAHDLAGIIRQRRWGSVHLIAHDYGAVMAWPFCASHPDLVSSYAALSIGHPVAVLRYPSFAGLLKNWFLVFNALPFAVPVYKARKAAFFNWAMRQHPDRLRVVRKLLADPDPFYIRAWELGNPLGPLVRSVLTTKLDTFPKLRCPTIGVLGLDDCYATVAPMRESVRLVANTFEYVPVEGAGHWLQLEAPVRVNTILLDWLKERADAPAQRSDA